MASKGAHAGLQGRVLGILQSAGSLGRVCGPAIGGFLLASDHGRPPIEYGNTPFLIGGLIMADGFVVIFLVRGGGPKATGTAVQVCRGFLARRARSLFFVLVSRHPKHSRPFS